MIEFFVDRDRKTRIRVTDIRGQVLLESPKGARDLQEAQSWARRAHKVLADYLGVPAEVDDQSTTNPIDITKD